MVLSIPLRAFQKTIAQCFITTQKQACLHFKSTIFWQNKKNRAKVHANEQFVNACKANFLLIDNSVKKQVLQQLTWTLKVGRTTIRRSLSQCLHPLFYFISFAPPPKKNKQTEKTLALILTHKFSTLISRHSLKNQLREFDERSRQFFYSQNIFS